MMRQGFDLEMKRCHVGEEAGRDELFQIGPGLGAMSGRAVQNASDGPYGLQEGWNAEVVECCRRNCHAEAYHKADEHTPAAGTRTDAPLWHKLTVHCTAAGPSALRGSSAVQVIEYTT